MSEFFESEIIQEELSEINRMQEQIYGSLMAFSAMSSEEKLEHIDLLKTLLEKQRVMYTRLSCLLYTSPSPRDLSTSRMPSSA